MVVGARHTTFDEKSSLQLTTMSYCAGILRFVGSTHLARVTYHATACTHVGRQYSSLGATWASKVLHG